MLQGNIDYNKTHLLCHYLSYNLINQFSNHYSTEIYFSFIQLKVFKLNGLFKPINKMVKYRLTSN